MPRLIAEGLTKGEMERAVELSNTSLKEEDVEYGGTPGPMLSWQNVQMRVGQKRIL